MYLYTKDVSMFTVQPTFLEYICVVCIHITFVIMPHLALEKLSKTRYVFEQKHILLVFLKGVAASLWMFQSKVTGVPTLTE